MSENILNEIKIDDLLLHSYTDSYNNLQKYIFVVTDENQMGYVRGKIMAETSFDNPKYLSCSFDKNKNYGGGLRGLSFSDFVSEDWKYISQDPNFQLRIKLAQWYLGPGNLSKFLSKPSIHLNKHTKNNLVSWIISLNAKHNEDLKNFIDFVSIQINLQTLELPKEYSNIPLFILGALLLKPLVGLLEKSQNFITKNSKKEIKE